MRRGYSKFSSSVLEASITSTRRMIRASSSHSPLGWRGRPSWRPHLLTMSNAIPKQYMALLKEAAEMFEETGCVPGIDGEQVPAQTIVPEVKEYISETIDDPEARYDPAIWDTPGFALVVSWLSQKW